MMDRSELPASHLEVKKLQKIEVQFKEKLRKASDGIASAVCNMIDGWRFAFELCTQSLFSV